MSLAKPMLTTNQLLDGLPLNEQNSVLKQCETVELEFGKTLCDRDHSFRYLYFPTTCFVSLTITLDGNYSLGLGLIGNEGVLGATLALGVNTAPSRSVVQGQGIALRISATKMRALLQDIPLLQRIFKNYLFVLLEQQTQNAACAHFHLVEQRLAGWLLMTQDRAHADHFHLTHEFLAVMLGVRRSGVTIAAGALKLRKLISYTHGDITILDRQGLEVASCECYGALLRDHARLFPSDARLMRPASC